MAAAQKKQSKISDDLFAPPTEEELKAATSQDDTLMAPPTEEELAAANDEAPSLPHRLLNQVETGGRSILESATLGLSEPVISGIKAGSFQLGRAVSKADIGELSPEKLGEAYQRDVDLRRGLKKEYPVLDIEGQVVGGLLPQGLAAKGAKAIGGAIESAGGLLKNPATGLLGKLTGGAGKVATHAAEGAGQAAGIVGTQNAILEQSGFQKPGEGPSVADTALMGGKLGAAIAIAPTLLKTAASGAKTAGKGLMSAALGPSVDDINAYLSRADDIRNAKSVEEIKNSLDTTMAGLFDDVSSGKMSLEQAKDTAKAVEQRVRDVQKDAGFQFQMKQFDAGAAAKEARNRLEAAFGTEKQKLSSIKSPIQMSDDVQTAVQDLKKKVVKGSKESFEILEKDPGRYSVKGISSNLRKMADDMNIRGVGSQQVDNPGGQLLGKTNAVVAHTSAPATKQSAAVQRELLSLAKKLESLPETVSAKEIKKILQQIDASEKAMYNQPGFDSRISQAYKGIRSQLDEQIKLANPEYAAKMQEVAGDTQLLDQSLERFSDPRATVSRLNSIAGRTSGEDRVLLSNLGKATGFDFDSGINAFSEAQDTLRSSEKLESIRRQLPEYRASRMAEFFESSNKRPGVRDSFIQNAVAKNGLIAEKAAAEKGIEGAKQSLSAAEQKLAPFKSLGPQNTQNAVKGLLRSEKSQSIELRKQIEALSKMSEKDFVKWIDDRRVADSFEKTYRNGSRNVNIWSFVLGGAGAAAGGIIAGPLGASAGAVTGGMVDVYGPKIAQKILDGVLKVQGSPTLKKIEALNLPADAKDYLSRSLIEYENAGTKEKGLIRNASGY